MSTEAVHLTSGGDKGPEIGSATANADDLKPLRDAVSSLPAPAVKDLQSIGVCGRCILRVFGIYESIRPLPLLPTSTVNSLLREVLGLLGDEDEDNVSAEHEGLSEPKVCRICFGILEFVYRDAQGILVRKDCANDFSLMIAKSVKQEHHQIDGFSLEVSLPPAMMENEQPVRLYMKKKYGSENWFRGKSIAGCISVKDALKLAITDPLETSLGIKSNISTFRIRLAYEISEQSSKTQDIKEINRYKRRKRGISSSVGASETHSIDSSTDSRSEHNELTKDFAKELEDHGSDCSNFLLDKDNQPFHLVFMCYRCPIYIGGRYLKYSRNVSQTCWIIEDERKGEASVEEIIGGSILPLCEGDSYKFHAAGREDIDVRMLGTGRPFLVEIQNARLVPSKALIEAAEIKINSLEHKLVRVKNLKILDNKGWAMMREGEAEKQKQYAALVWISRPLKDDDLHTLSSVTEMSGSGNKSISVANNCLFSGRYVDANQILQKTPIRVLHRRSPLAREKVIHWMKIEKIADSCQYFLLHLCTQAGTYIKEFVHGDLGRTHPSIGSILGCRAEILQLDVTDVKMDCF